MPPTITGKCALCHQTRELRDSHFLPKALYRLVRNRAGGNPNPVLLAGGIRLQTSSQVTNYLLCGECEQRFNVNGETWVLRHCYRGRGVFRLRNLLEQTTAIENGPDATVYSGSCAAQVEIDSLVYFAASVFWRAAVRNWRSAGGVYEAIRLGKKYEEEMRQYLLGEAQFPQHAVLTVMISDLQQPVLAWGFPDSLRLDSYHCHRLHIPGVTFLLSLGQNAPNHVSPICVLRSPVHPIYKCKHGDALVQTVLLALMGKIRTPRPDDSVLEGYEPIPVTE